MKSFKLFILIACFFLALFAFSLGARSYEKEMLVDCISSASKNTSIEGVSESSIENYCDCALDLIVDQNKDVRESGYECAVKNFQLKSS